MWEFINFEWDSAWLLLPVPNYIWSDSLKKKKKKNWTEFGGSPGFEKM